ncbi:MAG: hypothetical protein EBS19_15165, partial [Spirochaetia bacterium]|nr:hypothetical protein [Spirochaetia bacterium]
DYEAIELLHFADTKNFPYGQKSFTELKEIAKNIIETAILKECKIIVVACNTLCTVVDQSFVESYKFNGISIITITEKSSQYLLDKSQEIEQKKHMLILATKVTLESGIYQNILNQYAAKGNIKIKVYSYWPQGWEVAIDKGIEIDVSDNLNKAMQIIGEDEFQKGNYSKSIEYFKSSLKLNPVYPLTHSRYAHAFLLSGKLKFFKRSFFKSLEIHTNDPTISRKNIPQLFEDLRITLKNDDKLRKYFIHYLESNLKEYEPMISGIFSAEINLLLAYLYKYSDDEDESKRALENAKTLFLSIEESSSDYLDFQVQKKIETTENF